jgi:hypothetical protein
MELPRLSASFQATYMSGFSPPSALTLVATHIDLSTPRPNPIFGIFWHHPNGRPDPISLGHLGSDFDPAIVDTLAESGSQSR